MTPEQASKIICQRYELDLPEHEMKRMQGIIKDVATIKKKVLIKPTEKKKKANIKTVFEEICKLHNLTPQAVKMKNRTADLVSCRVHFVRYCYLNNFNFTSVKIAKFLNCDHSTVLHMRDSCKAECEIPPFNFKAKIKKK